MPGLPANGSTQRAETKASFASLPLPRKRPLTVGFTLAAGPPFLAVEAGSDSPALTSATSNRTSKLGGKHALDLIRLAGLADRAAVLKFKFAFRGPAAPADLRAAGRGAPVFDFPVLFEDEPEEGPLEIGVATLLLRFSRLLQFLVRHRLTAQDDRDRVLVVDPRLVGQRALQGVGLLVEAQRRLHGVRSLLGNKRDRAHRTHRH